ncbi:MAG: GIY-YIG nuclease family protein [Candidatus Dormibacteria bacterium]
MTGGYSIQIFVPSGNPDGLRVVQKRNWSGQGLLFPRSLFGEARLRTEVAGVGVYVLWESNSGELPYAYIGQSDGVLARLAQHIAGKEFWTHAVVFTSRDDGFNRVHAQYIEARLIDIAKQAKRCKLDNANSPQAPHMSEADIADAEGFLENMLLCLPMIGLAIFEIPRITTDASSDLVLHGKGIEARGADRPEGFVVRIGSEATGREVPSCPRGIQALRADLSARGVFVEHGDRWSLTQDYTFGSASTAAGVLLGRSSNGREEWRDAEGRSLKDIQQLEATQP